MNTSNSERWVLIAAILASSMAFIDSTALNVTIPAIQSDMNVNGSQLLWITSAYALFLSSLILVGGSLGDHFGRKRVFMIGIGLFTAASLACGLSPNADLLIIARAVQGIGGALMVPGSLSILSATFAPERRGQAIGTWSTFSTVTTLLGPLLGGWLASHGLWRAVFFVNVPLALAALWILATHVPESRDESATGQLDYLGAALATLGLAAVTYGFIEAPSLGLTDIRILLALVGGVVLLAAFIWQERRSPNPMMPLRLFQSRTFTGTNALTFFLYAALSVVPFFLSLNLIQIQGYSGSEAGAAFLPFTIILALLSPWMGRLVDRVGPRLPLTVGPFIAGVGFFLFALPGLTGGPATYWTTYFPASIALGIGMGITVAPLTTAVMGSAPQESSGAASGINNAVARTAGVLAVAVLGAIALVVFTQNLDNRGGQLSLAPEMRSALHQEASKLADAAPPKGLEADTAANVHAAIQWSFIDTFRMVAIVGAVLAWLSALLGWLLVENRPRVQTSVTEQ